MKRFFDPRLLAPASLLLALLVAVVTLTPPTAPAQPDPGDFSLARAMTDVREIARHPHPVGSTEHARVEAYLLKRMADLGLSPTVQSERLPADSAAILGRKGGTAAGPLEVRNLIGVLRGQDPRQPGVLVMAHYDSVPGSPGAADDATGVAAALEIARVVKTRGGTARDLIVLLTDGEEINLDGARLFFTSHPLARRIGAVVNMEARGGGGRAMMFETGPGNKEVVRRFGDVAPRPWSNSLAVFVYEHMPNGTDFSYPKEVLGLPGVNLAFLGRPAQYHTALSTPDALDERSLYDMGRQALAMTDAWVRDGRLPKVGQNLVYADLFGLALHSYPPERGWVILGLGLIFAVVAIWRVGTSLADIGRGSLQGLTYVLGGAALLTAGRMILGPAPAESKAAYYNLLAKLYVIEVIAVAALTIVAVGLIARRPLIAALAPRTPAGAQLGLVGLVLVLAAMAQALAPETAFLFAWPALLAGLAAAIGGRIAAFVATVVGGGWLMVQAHGIFLGVGQDFPAVLAPIALMILMLVRPLAWRVAPDPVRA